MNKLKIAGIIIMVAAAVVFLILFFGKHVNSTRYALLVVGTDRRSNCYIWNDDGSGK